MTLFTIIGIAGLLVISYALWIKNEHRQDILFVIGGIFLLIYSINIGDLLFVVLQVIFIVSALSELWKIRNQ